MARHAIREPEAFERLLSEILRRAAGDGNISEGELALRAGIAPETLSRIKSRRDASLGLMIRLAKIVGLRLTLVPDDETLEALERGEFF